MVIVDINEKLYEEVKKRISKNEVEYPTIKNFIDKAIKNKLENETY